MEKEIQKKSGQRGRELQDIGEIIKGRNRMEEEALQAYFRKGGFLYDIYQEEGVGPGRRELESEVTEYAVEQYQKQICFYSEMSLENKGYKANHREQMSTPGCFLTKNDYEKEDRSHNYIDIVGDVLTSMNTPILKCLENTYLQECRRCGRLAGPEDPGTEQRKALLKSVNAFIRVNHTIGNLMPVPEGLNSLWHVKDNIYCKIRCLKMYFDEKENLEDRYGEEMERIRQLFAKSLSLFAKSEYRKGIDITTRNGVCALWITEYFPHSSWEDFVEKNCLQDLFENENEYQNIKNCDYRKDRNRWNEWFDTMTELIVRRGYRLTHAGRGIEEDNGNLLGDIMAYLKGDKPAQPWTDSGQLSQAERGTTNHTIQIRPARPEEYPLLADFLYEAIYLPEGADAPPKEIICKPELAVYITAFGQPDDLCLVAESCGQILGAVWTRILAGNVKGYGNVDGRTPEFAISVKKKYRGQGIGSRLMREMITLLKRRGYEKASLSVNKENYACRMYEKLGFHVIQEQEDDYLMVRRLQEEEDCGT